MKLSILIVTRRPLCLTKLLNSICEKAYDFNNFELVLGYDSDDEDTKEVLSKYPQLNIREYVYPRVNNNPINKHEIFLNPMALSCSSDYIWALNDDVTIETDSFDKNLINELDSFVLTRKSGLLYAKVNEMLSSEHINLKPVECKHNYSRTPYAFYPILSKATVSVLGFFVPPELANGGADLLLSHIFHYSLANVFVKLSSVSIMDHRAGTFSNTNHVDMNTYSSDCFDRDVKKINDYIISNNHIDEQVISPSRVRVSIVFECKCCKADIYISNNATQLATICNSCGAPNLISDNTQSKSIHLTNLSNNIVRQLYA